LLGYLVRRLLENGANTSFINRLADENAPIHKIIANPVERIQSLTSKPHPHIPLPSDIFGAERKNSKGLDLSNTRTLTQLNDAMEKAEADHSIWQATPMIGKKTKSNGTTRPVLSPSQTDHIVGHITEATVEDVNIALDVAVKAETVWANTPVEERAA
jgi:RHH-type proline utilization regulon transcriptional repressor/proline dehydrogenase/delta 1-pyrroline-5-carboxylate dehydrogenase